MSLLSQADFARLHRVSKKAVTVWKQRGYLSFAGSMVDVELSNATLEKVGRFLPSPSPGGVQAVTSAPSRAAGNERGNPPGNCLAHFPASLAGLADGFASDASIELLRHLPEATARPIVAKLLALCRHGAVEMLHEDDVPVPAGLATWADHPAFKTVVPTEAEWVEAAELAKG